MNFMSMFGGMGGGGASPISGTSADMAEGGRFGPGVDPEAGVPATEYSGTGKVEGPNQGTGEGMPQMKYYEQLGAQLASAMQGPSAMGGGGGGTPAQQGGGLTAGFNHNWLNQAIMAGSANGEGI